MLIQEKILIAWVLFALRMQVASAIELHGVNPTLFNFVSDLVGVAIQLIFSLCLAGCYALFISRHIAGDKTVPLKALGRIPSDFVTGLLTARTMSWSVPILAFTALVAINQFSHAVADLGLSFDPAYGEGPLEPVLSLYSFSQNRAILIQAVGDPYNQRTEVNIADGLVENLQEEERLLEYQRQTRQVLDFLYAVDNVAKGVSPFLSPDSQFAKNGVLGSRVAEESPEYGGIPVVQIFHAKDVAEGAFLTGIDLALPLTCDGMVEIDQVQGATADSSKATAIFPACSYDSLRSSGIYSQSEEGSGEVASNSNLVRRAEISSYLYHLKLPQDNDFSVIANGKNFDSFLMPPTSRALARDRFDFRQGRFVDDIVDMTTFESMGPIEAIQIGSISCPVEYVVYAAGKSIGAQFIGTENELRMTEYGFVAVIEAGKCPEDPDGVIQPSCMAVLNVHCQSFPEDSAIVLGDIDKDFLAICLLFDIEILWGHNFWFDRELAVAVAGVYGRNRVATRGPAESVRLTLNLIPAAMLLLSSIDTMSSQVATVTPNIGGLYIFFMTLPLWMALVAVAVTALKKIQSQRFVIPDEPWKLAAVGNETNDFPKKRRDCHEEFPEATANLHYGILGRDYSANQQVVLGIILPGGTGTTTGTSTTTTATTTTTKQKHRDTNGSRRSSNSSSTNNGSGTLTPHLTPQSSPIAVASPNGRTGRQSNRRLDQLSQQYAQQPLPQVVQEISL